MVLLPSPAFDLVQCPGDPDEEEEVGLGPVEKASSSPKRLAAKANRVSSSSREQKEKG